MKILVVEDNVETWEYISRGLQERGDVADLAQDGHEGLFMARDNSYDVIVLDRMVPEMDGLTLLKVLRSSHVKTPVIFLTAMATLEDRVSGLDSGADDYLVKPFAFSELYARLSSLARRPPLAQTKETEFKCGTLELNLLDRTVHREGKKIDLHPTEFRLLEYFMRHVGKVVTRTMLLENVWGFHFDPKTNVVETHISRLRSKVDRDFNREMIKTVRGAGYRLDA